MWLLGATQTYALCPLLSLNLPMLKPTSLRGAQPRGMSITVSDEHTVLLCVKHHNEVQAFGPEAGWWQNQQVQIDQQNSSQ